MAVILLMVAITNPVVASVDEDEEEYESECDILDEEHYNPVDCDYSRGDCAQMFPPEYDYSSFQTCTGDVGWPNPGPGP